MALRSRNAAVLVKIQAAEGTYEDPVAGTDGIKVEVPQISFRPQNTDTDEVTGSLDNAAPLVGGMQVEISIPFYLKGVAVPGDLPQWGDLFRISGWSETQTRTQLAGITFSVTGTNTIGDTANGMGAIKSGTPIYLSSPKNPGVELLVSVAAAGSLTVTKLDGSAPVLVNEAAGGAFTISYGVPAVVASAGDNVSATAIAPWANVAQQYRGMPTLVSVNPAAAFFTSIIDYLATRVATFADRFAAPLGATSVLAIPANVVYRPISAAIPCASLAVYSDGIVFKFKDARGSVSLEMTAARVWKATVRISALFVSKTDAAVPAVTYDGTIPGVYRKSRFLINRLKAAIRSMSFDNGNSMVFPEDPNEDEGFSAPMITRRDMRATLDPQQRLVATANLLDDFRQGNPQPIHAAILGGNAAKPGGRIMFNAPIALFIQNDPGDRDGIMTEQIQAKLDGADAGAFLTVF